MFTDLLFFFFWLLVICHACCTACSVQSRYCAFILVLFTFKKGGGKKKYARLLLPKCSLYFYRNRLLQFFQVMGKIATLCHVENWMMTIFRNAFDQHHTKNGTKYVCVFKSLWADRSDWSQRKGCACNGESERSCTSSLGRASFLTERSPDK